MAVQILGFQPYQSAKHHTRAAWKRYTSLSLFGKAIIWTILLFYCVLTGLIVFFTPKAIAQTLYDRSQQLARMKYGYLVLGACIVLVSFPPLIGHTTLTGLCGFAYGMKGFYIVATASVLGSALVFVILRALFSRRLHAWSKGNEKWQALEAVVTAKGLPLIVLIRISPMPPWVYSNTLFASIRPVKLWQFVVATFGIFPKLLAAVFIGSRMGALSDGDQRKDMDTKTKVINSLVIGGGIVVSIVASTLVYHLVQGHIRHMDGMSPEIDELAAEAIEDAPHDERAALLRNFSDESVDRVH